MTASDRHGEDAEAGGAGRGRVRAPALTRARRRSSSFDPSAAGRVRCGLDERTEGLVKLAALVAMGAPATSYRDTVQAALDAGARDEEVIGTLIAVAGTVGLSRLVSATVALGLALGYDVEAALEEVDPPAAVGTAHGDVDGGPHGGCPS